MIVYAVLQSSSRFLELFSTREVAQGRANELTNRYPRQKPYQVVALEVR